MTTMAFTEKAFLYLLLDKLDLLFATHMDNLLLFSWTEWFDVTKIHIFRGS